MAEQKNPPPSKTDHKAPEAIPPVTRTPRELFQARLAKEGWNFRNIVRSDVFQESIAYSLGEFVLKFKPTPEQSLAVEHFLNLWRGLGEPESPSKPGFVMKKLDHSVFNPE